ncbi:MAG: hypothetical protein ACKPKO_19800, partial [Candidatus Fonsibacter sp.]
MQSAAKEHVARCASAVEACEKEVQSIKRLTREAAEVRYRLVLDDISALADAVGHLRNLEANELYVPPSDDVI